MQTWALCAASVQIVAGVSHRVMGKLSEGLYVTPTSLVATILALHRDGIREEDLVRFFAACSLRLLLKGSHPK